MDFPRECFPLVFEALHPETKDIVWTARVELPENLAALYVPPLRLQLGHAVEMRIHFGDGTCVTQPAPE